MFWSRTSKQETENLLRQIREFEQFCMGEKHLTPEQFTGLNMDLSLGAVQHLGKIRYENAADGRHVIWTGPDDNEYNLGPADAPDIMREYPGFHRLRSLALGHDMVEENTVIDAPRRRGQMSVVKMKDGTKGIAPNYRMALRNAALKVYLKHAFNAKNNAEAWNGIFGEA